jgi:hypothetical protein
LHKYRQRVHKHTLTIWWCCCCCFCWSCTTLLATLWNSCGNIWSSVAAGGASCWRPDGAFVDFECVSINGGRIWNCARSIVPGRTWSDTKKRSLASNRRCFTGGVGGIGCEFVVRCGKPYCTGGRSVEECCNTISNCQRCGNGWEKKTFVAYKNWIRTFRVFRALSHNWCNMPDCDRLMPSTNHRSYLPSSSLDPLLGNRLVTLHLQNSRYTVSLPIVYHVPPVMVHNLRMVFS